MEHNEEVGVYKEERRKEPRGSCCGFKVPYAVLLWSIHITVSVIIIVDRFEWNVWPRESFTVGKGTAGSDPDDLLTGPWSVKFFDIFARVSGRLSIWFLNVLLFTRMRAVTHFFVDSWISSIIFCWVDFSNFVQVHIRMHRWSGIVLAIGTLVHVWSIFAPCVFSGWGAKVVVGHFEYPISERAPSHFIEVDAATNTMSLQVDDVWRLGLMSVLLGVILPASVWWLDTRWHLGIQLHNFMMTMYFIDIVRRHTHPHSWCLNSPFYFLFFVDLLWSRVWWKRYTPKPAANRLSLGEDYMVMYWKHPYTNRRNTIGQDCYFLLQDAGYLERAHIFTTFENPLRIALEADGPTDWTVAGVLRVFHNRRLPPLGTKETISHTHRMAQGDELNVITWGPTQGEMSALVQDGLNDGSKPVSLIGAGSGINYLLDACQKHDGNCELYIFFTTRDKQLYGWACETLQRIIKIRGINPTQVVLALTGGGGSEQEGQADGGITFVNGRINFEDLMPQNGLVFAQGSASLKRVVKRVCDRTGNTYFGGLGGGQ